jgi:hypothetical protein
MNGKLVGSIGTWYVTLISGNPALRPCNFMCRFDSIPRRTIYFNVAVI